MSAFYELTFKITCCETDNSSRLRNEMYRIQRMIKLMCDTSDDSTICQYGDITGVMERME